MWRRGIAALLSGAVLTGLGVIGGAGSANADPVFNETVGGVANTWTNYTDAGGNGGPQIAAYQTVQIACKVAGFQVSDGNTWWYRIASSPWSYGYYVSADAFYNNGATSGSLAGTPFVDDAVSTCEGPTGPTETAGGLASTWTNYTNAGGAAGPQVAGGQTVQIACRTVGFTVGDGNNWWYQIGSAPWNNGFYVSADAFYNNGATSGALTGTPFVDTAIPLCSTTGPSTETAGGLAHTWANYSNAGGSSGPDISPGQAVQISCKTTGFQVADGNNWWYQIGSAPWSNSFYVSADAFYNNGATGGTLTGTPFVDTGIPDCAGSRSGAAASGDHPAPQVSLSQGPAAPAGYRYAVNVSGFVGSTVSVTCFDSVSSGGFYTFNLAISGGSGATAAYCYSGDGPDHWVTVNGIPSNHLQWGQGASSQTAPAQSGAGGQSGGGLAGLTSTTVSQPLPQFTYSNRRTAGWAASGACQYWDFNSNLGEVQVQYSPHVFVLGGILGAWYNQGWGNGHLGCAASNETDYQTIADDGHTIKWALQQFSGGWLFWTTGMHYATQISPQAAQAINTASACLAQGYCTQHPNEPADYDGYCLAFVYDAYQQNIDSPSGPGSAAYMLWDDTPLAFQTRTDTAPPPGALPVWSRTAVPVFGHVALSIGGGYAISTGINGASYIRVMKISNYRNYGYDGWVSPKKGNTRYAPMMG